MEDEVIVRLVRLHVASQVHAFSMWGVLLYQAIAKQAAGSINKVENEVTTLATVASSPTPARRESERQQLSESPAT